MAFNGGPGQRSAVDRDSARVRIRCTFFEARCDIRRERRPSRSTAAEYQVTYCGDDVTAHSMGLGRNQPVDPTLLASTWPAVSERLRAALRMRGVPRADRDDIVQEVAARVLSARPVFTSPDELYGWARTVGL